MQMISSGAGTRLAKATKACQEIIPRPIDEATAVTLMASGEGMEAFAEYLEAAWQVADELVANGYHDLDGGEE